MAVADVMRFVVEVSDVGGRLNELLGGTSGVNILVSNVE